MATNDGKDIADRLNLVWNYDSEYGLSEFLDMFTLPQLVKVSEGIYGESDDSTLPSGQTLTLHVVKDTKMYRGCTYHGYDVLVPLNCPQKVEVRPQSVSIDYDTVEQLCVVFAQHRVKYVRVTKDHHDLTAPERCLRAGQKLKLEYVTKNELFCLDEDGCEVCLPMDVQGGFQPLADNREYFLAEICEHFSLPIYVQFTSKPKFSVHENYKVKKSERFLYDLIQLDEVIIESTVIASTESGGRKTILTFPRSLDVDLLVPEQLLAKESTYARVCETLNDGVDLVKAELLTVPQDEVIYGTREKLVREFSYSAEKFGLGVSGFDVNDNLTPFTADQDEGSTDTEDNDGYIEIDKIPRKGHDYLYVDAEDYAGILHKSVDGEDKRSKMSVAKCSSNTATIPREISPPKVRSSSLSSMKSFFRKLSRLKGEKQRQGHTETQKTKGRCMSVDDDHDSDDDAYECVPEVSRPRIPVESMSVTDVANLLQSLQLGDYAKSFTTEQVDGRMLRDLTRTDLHDHFNMIPFHAQKLYKAVNENWRPKLGN